jgi:dipeptidyl aminopeptidase/acylaminoacyl peptidase
MRGPGFVGALPDMPEWSLDGQYIYYTKKFPDSVQKSFFSYHLQTGKTELISAAAWQDRWVWTPGAGQLNAFRIHDEKLEYLNIQTKQIKSYPLFTSSIWNLQLQKNVQTIAFQQGQSLFLFDLQNGMHKQLMSYQKAPAPKEKGTAFSEAELELFESERKKQLQSTLFDKPKIKGLPFEPNGTLQVDPSARYVLIKKEISHESRPTEVPHFISSDAHVYTEKSRAKVQNEEPTQAYFLHDLRSDSLVQLDFSQLTQMGAEDRALFLHPVIFAQTKALALCDIRSSDNKDRWLVCIDLATRQIQELEHQHDSAWIGGPGISSWNMETATLGWLKDASVIYFQSEQSGYSHLYTLDISTKIKMALTSGSYEVHQVQLSKDSMAFYLSTNMLHPGTRAFYKLNLKTLELKPLLCENGAYEVQLSPDEKQLAYRFSTSTKPWEIYTCSLKNLTTPIQLTNSTTEAFRAINWQKPEILSFKASDSVSVYARLYTPKAEFKNGAAVLFVHGAGYLQNAHHYWSYYQREFMFHQLLIDKGYTVLDVDYRASEGYGRDYRTAIYRHMGGRDLQDFVDAKHFLVTNYAIDSNRVGIYGGSYGGFITLMGLFTEPGTFACGAALRAVTDWAHYNHEYTTNILNTPAADAVAYRQSSPIYFAEGLEDPLLILHGMIDDNVQFQDVVRLNQRLIELGKKDWWMALYPVERHSFEYSSSWTDEYRRILELFETYLK